MMIAPANVAPPPAPIYNLPDLKRVGNSKKMSQKDKPRNVMLHRLRSIKARSLQDKYDINWDVVLGEGAYGAVYPGKLRSTGEKVSK